MLKKLLVIILLFSCAVQAQEMTKEEKRAKRKNVRLYLKKSIAYFNNHQLDSASLYIDSLLTLAPKNPDAYYYLGLIHIENADTTLADSVLSQGSDVAPLSTRIKILLSRIKIEQKDFEASAELLDAILRIKPREPETLYLRGITYLHMNDTTKAIEYLKHGLERALVKGK